MGTQYRRADRATHELVRDVMHRYHRQLEIVGCTVVVVVVSSRDSETETLVPVLRERGYSAAALVNVTPIAWRACDVADVRIRLDAAAWEERSERQRSALIDRCLSGLDLRLDDDLLPMFDTCDRPMLERVLADAHLEWHGGVAARWGEDSLEVEQARELYEGAYGQCLFPFAKSPAPGREPKVPRWPEERLAKLAEVVEALASKREHKLHETPRKPSAKPAPLRVVETADDGDDGDDDDDGAPRPPPKSPRRRTKARRS